MQINDFVFIVNEFCSSLRKHVHAVYIDFFSSVKIEISPEKMIFLTYLLKTYFVGTC